MTKRIYNYEKYLNSSTKLKKFLKKYENRESTHRAYKLHLVRYFQTNNIENIDDYVQDTRMMNKKQKIKYLDQLEQDLTNYWITINKDFKGKTPYIWLSAIKMFLIHNKTFELDDVYIELQKSGHGNYSVTNTQTPTKKQLLKIFSYSDPESKALFMFQITSGQRIGQVLETTFDNIKMDFEYPRIYYPTAKQKYYVKTRITPETKKILQEYLDQRDRFIQIRIKRGEHCRKEQLDLNKIFPMTEGTANTIWNTMVKNAGLYELDPTTKKPVFGTHCLRRYFLSYFSDREIGDFFAGHITPRNKEYRLYTDKQLDEFYKTHVEKLNIFESTADVKDLQKENKKLEKEVQQLKENLERIDRDLRILVVDSFKETD